MTRTTHLRTNIVLLMGLLVLSSSTMLWLFWRFPISTAVATVAVLAAIGLSARLASPTDSDLSSELDHSEPGLPTR